MKVIKIRDGKDLRQAFNYVNFVQVSDNLTIYDTSMTSESQITVYDENKETENHFTDFDDVLNFKINRKAIKEFLKDSKLTIKEVF